MPMPCVGDSFLRVPWPQFHAIGMVYDFGFTNPLEGLNNHRER